MRPMVIPLFVSLGVLGALANPALCESPTEQVKRLATEWVVASDAVSYERLLADDFVGQWADGSVSGKKETIDAVRSGQDVYEFQKMGDDARVRIFGDTGVVTGTFLEKSTLSGKDGTGTYRFTGVWVKRKGVWQMVAFQSLRLTTEIKTQ